MPTSSIFLFQTETNQRVCLSLLFFFIANYLLVSFILQEYSYSRSSPIPKWIIFDALFFINRISPAPILIFLVFHHLVIKPLIIMMASSQVEIAPSSPFGCAAVHNPRRRDSCFNQLVTSCNISNDASNSSSRHIDLWVHQPQWQTTTTTTTTTPNHHNNNNNNKCNNNNDDKQQQRKDDKWARAREMVLSVGDHHRDSPKQRPERLVEEEVSNLRGVSSLVQKWRGFEAEAKFSSGNSSRSNNTTINSPDNAPVLTTSTSGGGGGDEDPFGEDWESSTSSTVAFSAPAASPDATERERLRVADIIRKLTDDVVASCESPPRVRTSSSMSSSSSSILMDHQTTTAEQRCCFSLSSPRIRGRQAYNDLLTQMERDRQRELQGLVARKSVSNFSHRGRIQALLRFRFLRRGIMEPPQLQGRPSNTTSSSESHKPMRSPALVHLRERVHPSSQNSTLDSDNYHKELIDNNPSLYAASQHQQGNENQCNQVSTNSESCSRGAYHIQDSQCSRPSKHEDFDHQVNENIKQILQSYEHVHRETSLLSTNYESSNDSLDKSAETDRTFQNTDITSAETFEINVHKKEEVATHLHHVTAETNYDTAGDCDYNHKGESDSDEHNNMYWVSDVPHPDVGWQEMHSDYQQQEGINRDWIDEVSRPRSDWEDLRQARYQEMLDPFVDNDEIRALLGRRSVSTFLSSGLRERIDRLMISRAEGKQSLKSNPSPEEGKDERLPEQEQLLVSEEGEGEEDTEDEQDVQGGDFGDYFDEYEEAESSVGQQYDECDDCADNVTSSPAPSWPQNQGHDLSAFASPCTQQSSSYYSQDNVPSSSFRAQPAIEMELIYGLRGHMEQLHQEMSELRKSIKCCMDMQIELQRSIKKEVANAVALNHSGCADAKNGGRKSVKKVTSGGRCCVCCKMQVDSLLYRCGHMCTCFKCAHELQWSSGKCPICRAPILDVVRTYSNHSSYKPT